MNTLAERIFSTGFSRKLFGNQQPIPCEYFWEFGIFLDKFEENWLICISTAYSFSDVVILIGHRIGEVYKNHPESSKDIVLKIELPPPPFYFRFKCVIRSEPC